MSSERHSKLAKPLGASTRVLSWLLLGFIVFGTTVEAAHTHGSLRAAKAIVGASNISDPATETKTTTNLTGCGDCLICQLHQGFSTSLISVPPSLVPSALRSRIFNLTAVSVASETNAPRRGRAPPLSL